MNTYISSTNGALANLEAERAVLGACIVSSKALGDAIEALKPDDFADPRHKALFSAMLSMYSEDMPVDYITLSDELASKDLLQRLGGQSFIDSLITGVTSSQNVSYHASIVRDRAIRRKLVGVSSSISSLAYEYDKNISEILDTAEKMLFDAGQNKDSSQYVHVREIIPSLFQNIEERMNNTGVCCAGYQTSFVDIDNMTGGFQPGSLVIIAGRPSMGKTAFAMNIAQFGGRQNNVPVLVFSLEMPASHVVLRMISAESEVDLSRLMNGMIDSSEFGKVRKACDIVAKRNIFINDSTVLSAAEFRGRCRRFKTRYPDVGLVVVDYLQLMSPSTPNNNNRVQEVAEISRMLKATAREIDCPVVALSQLSRNAENRTDKQPQLSDLRDSGAIEQDADLVMLMYREDYYSQNENTDLKDSVADIRVAKNRNGSTGVFHLTFKREITRFYNYGEM